MLQEEAPSNFLFGSLRDLESSGFFSQICEVGGLVTHKRTAPNLITFFIIYQFGCDYFCKFVDDAMTNM